MNTQELRIGNFIQDAAMNIETVKSLNNFGGDDINEDSSFSEYFGIPLTEKWLIKFGFEVCDDEFNVIFYSKQSKFWVKHEARLFLETRYGIEIKYVHQLQNLFYCLTGKELSCD